MKKIYPLWAKVDRYLPLLVFGTLISLLMYSVLNNTIYYGQTALTGAIAGLILWILVLYKNKQNIPLFLLYCSLGFLLFSWLSFFFSHTRTVGLNEVVLDTGLILLLLSLPGFFKANKKGKEGFLGVVVGLGAFQAIWAFAQYLTRTEPRAAGLFFNPQIVADYYPNAFALSSLLFLALALGFLFKKGKIWQWFGGVSSALMMGGLFLSWSRGGILGLMGMLFLGLILLIVTYKNGKTVLKLMAVSLVGLVLAIGFHYQRVNLGLPSNHLIAKAQFSGTEAQTSVGERKDFMVNGIKLAMEKPLLGYGPGSFSLVYPQKQEIWLANAPHAHNWLIKLAMERGMPTAFFFLSFWLMLLGLYLKNRKRHDPLTQWAFIGILASLGHNLIDFNFNFTTNIVLLAILGSLLMAELTLKPVKKPTQITFWVANGLILVLLMLSSTVIYANRYSQYAKYQLSKAYAFLDINPFYAGSDYILSAQWNVQQKDFERAEENYKKHVKLNIFDASAWNQLGEVYFTKGEYEMAQKSFAQALELDDKNQWKYYLNKFKASTFLNKDETLHFIQARLYLEELEVYLPLVKQNIHYTAQQENSLWAQELAVELQNYLTGENLAKVQEIEFGIQKAREKYEK